MTIKPAITLSKNEIDALKKQFEIFTENQDFGGMRKLLEQAHDKAPDDVWVTQKLAVCT